jgi:alpha/beta superfamily hydrolase
LSSLNGGPRWTLGYDAPAMHESSEQPAAFPAASGPLLLRGPAGRIEALAGVPAAADARRGVALICHPHPLHGGTMHNKVVSMLERSLLELGLHTLRFNFGGVGESEGVHDDGDGETVDAIALGEWLVRVRPGDVLWLCGFSFGSMVAARAARHLPAKFLVGIAPPIGKYPVFDALPALACPWLIVQGEDDDIVEPQVVFDFVARAADPPMLVRMPGTGHFFHRKLLDLRGVLKHAARDFLPPPVSG